MTLEKKIAIASVALCLLTSLAFSIHLVFGDSYLVEEETSVRIQIFFRNLVAWFWAPMIASFILYTRGAKFVPFFWWRIYLASIFCLGGGLFCIVKFNCAL